MVRHCLKERWIQQDMTRTLLQHMQQKQSLLMEAPTGTGKTLAYLAALGEYLHDHPDHWAVISSATKHLQVQVKQDILKLKEYYPHLESHVAIKGRQNYVCLYRAIRYLKKYPHNKEIQQLTHQWKILENLPHGWREELPMPVSQALWENICSKPGCCQRGVLCYYHTSRQQSSHARVVILNHALLGLNSRHLATPVYQRTMPVGIIDEAHVLPDTLLQTESSRISLDYFQEMLGTLQEAMLDNKESLLPLIRLEHRTSSLLSQIENITNNQVITPQHPEYKYLLQLADVLQEGCQIAERFIHKCEKQEIREDLQDYLKQWETSQMRLRQALLQQTQDYVVLLNKQPRFEIVVKPLFSQDALSRLWQQFRQVNLISATLIGTSLQETKETYAADHFDSANYPPVFDYIKQLRILFPPKQHKVETPEQITEILKTLIQSIGGGVMTLFTNYDVLEKTQALMEPFCNKHNIPLLAQKRNISSEHLAEQYQQNPNALLLGSYSMGLGVNLHLKALVLTRIPFEQQSAYLQMRQDVFMKKGRNPFYQLVIPETIRRWKQWVGRLIRQENSCGLLVLLDPRLFQSAYGHYFLNALPHDKGLHWDDSLVPGYLKEYYAYWKTFEHSQTCHLDD